MISFSHRDSFLTLWYFPFAAFLLPRRFSRIFVTDRDIQQAELAAVQKELEAAAQSCIQKRQAQLRHAAALADSLSPYRVLGRGYAMVYDSKGRLCSADVLATGDKLTLRGAAHTAECTVTSVEELNESTQKL